MDSVKYFLLKRKSLILMFKVTVKQRSFRINFRAQYKQWILRGYRRFRRMDFFIHLSIAKDKKFSGLSIELDDKKFKNAIYL